MTGAKDEVESWTEEWYEEESSHKGADNWFSTGRKWDTLEMATASPYSPLFDLRFVKKTLTTMVMVP